MDLPDSLLTVFSSTIEYRDGTPVLTVPERELSLGELEEGETYRVALLAQHDEADGTATAVGDRGSDRQGKEPPVQEGEQIDVEIEDIGEQGDGIARVGPGYIVFVPDTEIGDRVTVEVTDARENFAFADVIEPEPVSESEP